LSDTIKDLFESKNMELLQEIIESLPEGKIHHVCIGLNWTAVVAESRGILQCGLSSTLSRCHEHSHEPDVLHAGRLEELMGKEIATFAMADNPTLASIGVAAINALLHHDPSSWNEANAEDVLAAKGVGKNVVFIGRFHFIEHIRHIAKNLVILEQNPGADDLPAESAPIILPQAEVIAITGMTIVNHTLGELLELCSPNAFVMVLGPSTPLSTVLFKYGVDHLSGAIVTDINPVLKVIQQGGNFHQVRRNGVRLVNINKLE